MQFFGGKTGGKEIEHVMKSLGLSMEEQKKREEQGLLHKSSESSLPNRSGQTIKSQSRLLQKLASSRDQLLTKKGQFMSAAAAQSQSQGR